MEQPKKENYHLAKTLILSVLSAVILIGGLISFYGSDYKGRDLSGVLIAPKVLFSLNYLDVDSKSGKKQPFIFDSVQFHSDRFPEGKRLSKEQFHLFYSEIKNDRSVNLVPKNVMQEFDRQEGLRSIHLYVRPKDSFGHQNSGSRELFQQIQFSPASALYRVSPRSQEASWLYFRHPSGFAEILELIEE